MAVTGPELDEMSDAELDENIEKILSMPVFHLRINPNCRCMAA